MNPETEKQRAESPEETAVAADDGATAESPNEVDGAEPEAQDSSSPGAETGQAGGSEAEGDAAEDAKPEDEQPPESELEVAQRERGEYLELAQRTRAELDNFRKRAARDAASAETRGRASLAKGLLPAIDNLERALQAAGVPVDGEDEAGHDADPISEEVSAHRALAEGVALVYRDLRTTLERAGVEGYDPLGESFDPVWHEAVATVTPESGEDGSSPPSGQVLETLEKGYRLGDVSLRPARVVVSA